jgi:virulence factor Mce-like protein
MMRRVALAVVTVMVASALTACTGGGDDGYHLTAYFERGVSLYAGGEVRVLGLPAGDIDRVAVEGRLVRVDMTMRATVPVPADVEATIVPLSLIGERYVQLFPAWIEGQPRARSGAVIPRERTSVPVEPDEALAALKRFLDSLDPSATGRLVTNLAGDLSGNGEVLNTALEQIADLTVTLADKDDELVRILEHFDDFTATLVTREQQLGRVLDGFATTAAVLAAERQDIERLVRSLAALSTDALDLVAEHRVRLQRDVEVLTHTLLSVQTNMDSVRELLDAAPLLVAGADLDGLNEGLAAAYDPVHHRIDLRNTTSPIVSDLFRTIGLPSLAVCLPLDVSCTPGSGPLPSALSSPPPEPARRPAEPIAAVVGLVGSPTDARTTEAAELAAPSTPAGAPRARAGWLTSVARTLAEVLP